MDTLPAVVYVIWWIVLAVVVLVIVPLAISLLHRALRAASFIREYLADMLAAGVGIAGNTAAIAALDDTLAVAGGMVQSAEQIKAHTGTIAGVFAERAARGAQR